ncbi:MAG: methionine synthase [Clostridiales bacterium]|nr:methionine synthase [Clostridiales bacterium]
MNEISRSAWLNALKVKDKLDEELNGPLNMQMDLAQTMLFEAAKPKTIYKVVPREELPAAGFSIERHLEKCHKAAVLAATLGVGVDNLVRRVQITDMAMALVLDCGASILIQQICDDFEKAIKTELSGFLTSRFSPGYGDYGIQYQGQISELLDAPRKIGLAVTRDSLMIPRKSITAVIGISDVPVKGRLAGCDECMLKNKCELKKEGKFCGD